MHTFLCVFIWIFSHTHADTWDNQFYRFIRGSKHSASKGLS